ncbi:MAG: hypothetical protein KJS68_07700 [Alphaproteobacteria bacterium]|nr:hypothetical protein [Alphaproteobacteria bacterium]
MQDEVHAAFAEAGEAGDVIVRGAPHARVLLKITAKRLYLLIDGEPPGKCLSGVFIDAIRNSKLKRSMSALVDLTGFTGQVDWDHVGAVRRLAAWGRDGRSNVAYIVRNEMFHGVIKVARAMFDETRHEIFFDRADATAWLDSVEGG